MTLKKRIDRLAPNKGQRDDGPSVIFLCAAETAEAWVAMIMGGETLSRDPSETEADFIARASGGVANLLKLPLGGREALAIGKAPRWATGNLVLRALKEKHATDP
jgi:hypothetical protein